MLEVQDAQYDDGGIIREGKAVSAKFFTGSGSGDGI